MGGRTVEDVREDFPILDRTVHGKTLAYLDNAATSQKPRAVLDAVRVYYERGNANVHRALHALGEEATAAFEQDRAKAQRFLNARSKREVIFTRGTTEAINLVASSWGDAFLEEGDVILLTDMEHHSNLVPWQLLCARKGCTLAFIPLAPDGSLDLEKAEKQWTDRIRLVALTHVSNVLGTVNDVKAITEMAHARGALVLVDGAQSVPHFRVDVADIDCDFLAFSGHKMCAPMGIGVLYGKEQILDRMPPWMGGGEMISAVHREKSTWNELPYKFEAGTPNVEGAIGLGAAIDYLHSLELPAIQAWEAELARYALERLREIPQLSIYGSAEPRGAVVSFNLGTIHAHDIAQYLDKEGIAVRAGHHCAQPLMRLLDIPGTARASFYFYNTFAEIDRLHDALLAAAEFYA